MDNLEREKMVKRLKELSESILTNTKSVGTLKKVGEDLEELKDLIANLVPPAQEKTSVQKKERVEGVLASGQQPDLFTLLFQNLFKYSFYSNNKECRYISVPDLDQTVSNGEYGESLRGNVASDFARVFYKKQNKKEMQKWKKEYKVPVNAFGNTQLCQLLSFVSLANVSLARMTEVIQEERNSLPAVWKHDLKKMVLQSATFISFVNQNIREMRMEAARSVLGNNGVTITRLFGAGELQQGQPSSFGPMRRTRSRYRTSPYPKKRLPKSNGIEQNQEISGESSSNFMCS